MAVPTEKPTSEQIRLEAEKLRASFREEPDEEEEDKEKHDGGAEDDGDDGYSE